MQKIFVVLRKLLLFLFGLVLVGLVILIMLPTPVTARSKVMEVILAITEARQAIAERCREGTLTPGMNHVSLGFPEHYKPTIESYVAGEQVDYELDFIRQVTVNVESPQRVLITATLEDIYDEYPPFRKDLKIPAGGVLAITCSCEDGQLKFDYGQETTIPEEYLLDSLRSNRGEMRD
jgi:hypothetical protein